MSMTRSTRGFTLAELMVVIAIVGILAAIALPRYLSIKVRVLQAEAKIGLSALRLAELSYAIEHGSYTTCIADIGFAPSGQRRYFAIGFSVAAANSTGCGVNGTAPCSTQGWISSGASSPCSLAPEMTNNIPFFYPATTAMGPSLPAESDLWASSITQTSFTAAAAGPSPNWIFGGIKPLISTAHAAPPTKCNPKPGSKISSFSIFTINEKGQLLQMAPGSDACP